MAGEFKNLSQVTYDDIGPFPMQQHSEDGDIMRRSRYEFSHRDDQDQEPQAVAPLVWSGEFLFLNGLDGLANLWPQTFMKMKARVKQPELAFLEHPLYGPTWGYFEKFSATYSKDELNGCRVQFVFQRCSEDEPAPGPRSFDSLSLAEEQAAVADAGLEQLATPPTVSDEPGPSPQLQAAQAQPPLSQDVQDFQTFLQQEALTADTIAAECNRLRDQIATLLQVPELLDAQNAEVRQALLAVNAAITSAATDAQADAAQIIELPPLDFAMGPLEIALWLYQDPARAEDIVALNPIELFDYAKGAILRVADL